MKNTPSEPFPVLPEEGPPADPPGPRTALRLFLSILAVLIVVTILHGCSSLDPAKEHFEEAERLLGEGDYPGAIRKYSYIISNFQRSSYGPKSQYMIAVIYNRHLLDDKKASEAYSTLFFLYPESMEARLAREDVAGIYSRQGEHDRAIEEYEKVLKENLPADRRERIRYLVAMEYLKMNDFTQARIELQDLLKTAVTPSTVPKLRYQVAYSYYIEGDFQKALKEYDGIIADFPKDSSALDARLGKAKVLEESGRLAEALEILKGLEGSYPNREALRTRMEWVEKRIKEAPGIKQEDGR